VCALLSATCVLGASSTGAFAATTPAPKLPLPATATVQGTGTTPSATTPAATAPGITPATEAPATAPPATTAPATPAAGGARAVVVTHTSSGSSLSGAAIVAAVLAGLVALACLAWGLARMLAYEPHWMLSLRHSLAEAGFRASATWAELSDWARLGR
jgi:hypothetical protein